MTEQERNEQLEEIGREVADLSPDFTGSVTFDIKEGELAGIRQESRRRPKDKPT